MTYARAPWNGKPLWKSGPLTPLAGPRRSDPESASVRLRAPHGIGSVYTFSGRYLNVREDGTVEMSAEDAEYLIRHGWSELAEWDSTEDA